MKRGAISIETIIIIILALIVLVVVAAAFSGGMKNLWDKIMGTTEIELSQAKARCDDICTSARAVGKQELFDNATVTIRNIGVKYCKEITSC
ncbi:MAG: hypothetical protein QW041_01255 [Candidatus Pacearchaeota archaeon]